MPRVEKALMTTGEVNSLQAWLQHRAIHAATTRPRTAVCMLRMSCNLPQACSAADWEGDAKKESDCTSFGCVPGISGMEPSHSRLQESSC